MVKDRILGYNFLILVSIASFIGFGMLSGGLALYFFGGMRSNFLSSVDVDEQFIYLGEVCVIEGVYHISETINGFADCGDGCTSDITVCEDTVIYNFTYNDVLLTSRTFVSYRNEVSGYYQGDRCTEDAGNMVEPYEGFISDGVPFVCEGECEVGEVVDCWESSSVDNYNQESWANCGNEECIKLVDPSIEHTDAVEKAQTISSFGRSLLSFGALLAVVPAMCYLLVCKPHIERASEKITLHDNCQTCSMELVGLDGDELCSHYTAPNNIDEMNLVQGHMTSRAMDNHKIV
jgi:hypothetical protein